MIIKLWCKSKRQTQVRLSRLQLVKLSYYGQTDSLKAVFDGRSYPRKSKIATLLIYFREGGDTTMMYIPHASDNILYRMQL